MSTLRLTAAQALCRYLLAQSFETDEGIKPYFAGVWAIFGHGNVAGMGEALYGVRDQLPTYRAHNEQAMAHAAIAFAKQKNRQQIFACTTSIGPGATNMVTAAALAHVNRLPVLFLPGDVYANRRPDPVLQQIEDFADATVSANDCFRPVSRYFDRITRPEQLLKALPRAMSVLTDPELCGPVTLALCQDVQAEAFDYPSAFFEPRVWRHRRQPADITEFSALEAAISSAKKPVIIAGGGVKYSRAEAALADFATRYGIPVCETQAGKGALTHDHHLNLGAVGVTGSDAANMIVAQADLIIAVGTRLQDFTTGSAALFNPSTKVFGVNVCALDAAKMNGFSVIGDAKTVLSALKPAAIQDPSWHETFTKAKAIWTQAVDAILSPELMDGAKPTDAQVLGALMRAADKDAIVVAAAGGLPGDLHKFWRTQSSGGYHMEYGFSCMGYEIAGGLGVALAEPDRHVYVLVGDGSYLMMNSEIATAAMMGLKLTLIIVDNRGFGCIHRLQKATGGAPFNNRLEDSWHTSLPDIDFVAHAQSLGARAQKVDSLAALEAAVAQSRQDGGLNAIVIDTEALPGTSLGGVWWDVAVAEVSDREEVRQAFENYQLKIAQIRDKL